MSRSVGKIVGAVVGAVAAVVLGPAGWATWALAAGGALAGAAYGDYVARQSARIGDQGSEPSSRTIRSSKEPAHYLLGRFANGGVLTWVEQDEGDPWVHLVLALSEGPIDGVDDVLLDKKSISEFTGGVAQYQLSVTPTEANTFMRNNSADWDEDVIGKGLSFIRVSLRFDPEQFPNGLPEIQVIGRGRKDIWDPRTDERGYTDNPALILLWWMTEGRANVPLDEINLQSFIDAANVCDEIVENPDGTQSKRYTMGAVISDSELTPDVIDKILATCNGQLIRIGGVLSLQVGAYYGPGDITLTEDMVIGAVSGATEVDNANAINTLTGTFTNPDDWTETDFPPVRVDEWVLEDGAELAESMQIRYVLDPYQAQRLANMRLRKRRNGGAMSIPMNFNGYRFRPGRVVNVDLPSINMSGEFIVVDWTLGAADGCVVHLEAYDATMFDDDVGRPYTPPSFISMPTGSIETPANLEFTPSDDPMVKQGTVTWTPPPQPVQYYGVTIRRDGEAVQTYQVPWSATSCDIQGLGAGQYVIEIYARGELGRSGTASVPINLTVPEPPIDLRIEVSNNVIVCRPLANSPGFGTEFEMCINYLNDPDFIPFDQLTGLYGTFPGLTPDTEYPIYARTISPLGKSEWFSQVARTANNPAEIIPSIREELDGIDTSIGEINTELLGINTELDGINLSIQDITVDLGDLSSDITAITTEVGNLTTSIGEINDELDLVDSSLFAIDNNLDDLDYRVTYGANQGEDLELLALDSIIQQSASREDLRARLEKDEQLIGAVVYVDPTTGTIVNRAYQYTDASFTQAAVLIDGVDAKVTLLTEEVGIIEGEVNNLSSELSLIPGQITATANAVVAEAISALEPAHTFNFYDSAQGWTAVNGTLSDTTPNQIQVTWGDIQNTSLNFLADDNTSIRITIERTGGTGWVGDLYLERDDTSTETFVGIIEDIPAGGEIIRIIDMRGVDGWDGNITKLRLVLGASAADTFVIKQIVIGKPDANLLELEDITARVTQAELDINAVEGELSQRVTTSYYNNNTVTYGNVEQVLAASPTITSIENSVSLVEGDVSAVVARVDQVELDVDGATTAITALEGQVNNPTANNSALYNFIQTAQSTADGNTQSITNLTSRIDTAEGDILANAGLIQGVRADVDDNIIAISALEGSVNDPNTGLSATYTLAGEAKSTADGNSTALANLTTRVADAESDISANASLIQQVELDVEGNTSAITSLTNRVTDAEGDIVANTGLLQAARQDIDGNITAISALEGSVNDPQTGLAITYTNASNALSLANNNASSITTLDNRITDAEGDIVANAGLIQGVRADVDGNTDAISLLQGSVNDPATGLSAAYQLANTAKVTADNNASSISVLEGSVNDPVSGLSATNQIAQQAYTTANGNAQAITELDTRVTTTEGFTEAQIILNSEYEEELDQLGSSITNRTFQIVGNYEDFEDSQLQQLDALVSVAEARAGQLDRNLSFADAISRIEVSVGENGSIAKAITQLEAVTNTQAGLIEANAVSVQQVRTDLDGAADSITVLQGQVNDPQGNPSALYSFIQTAQQTADNNTTAINSLTTTVNDPVTGLSVTNTLAQNAFNTADGNTQAITQLDARITDNEDFAAAQLQLNAGYDNDLDQLFARAFLGTNVNNVVTGIVIDGVTQQIEFQSNSVAFLDGNSQPMIYFDNANGRYVFDGHIVAQTGTFSGTVSGGSIVGGDINIGGGTFTVDSSGNMVARSGSFYGSITTAEDSNTGYFTHISPTPFGTTGDLVEWYGEKVSGVTWNNDTNTAIPAGMSKLNAKTYKTKNGSVFFGGTFQAGTLSLSRQTTNKTGAMTVATGVFTIPGGTSSIVVAASVVASGGGAGLGTCPLDLPSASAVVNIEMLVGGTWQNIGGSNSVAQFHCSQEGPEVLINIDVGAAASTSISVTPGQAITLRATATTVGFPTTITVPTPGAGGDEEITVDGSRSLSIAITGE